jgi:hypothetical protein
MASALPAHQCNVGSAKAGSAKAGSAKVQIEKAVGGVSDATLFFNAEPESQESVVFVIQSVLNVNKIRLCFASARTIAAIGSRKL